MQVLTLFEIKLHFLGCFEGLDCFALASSDGTVAISHCNPINGSWGVRQDDNQTMLFQRCIGLGTFHYSNSLSDSESYVCCCLRGGTIYVVPVRAENDVTDNEDLLMFPAPLDPNGDDDGLVRLTQSFTAGMAQVEYWKGGVVKENADCCTTKSVALLGWPGGTIDVYELTLR